jgi:Flp pilus assembly protein CpaB
MVVAALLAAVLNFALLRQGESTVSVAVATAEIPAGTKIDSSAISAASVGSGGGVTDGLVTATDRAVGQIATTRLSPGDPLRGSDLRAPAAPERQRAMSVPVARAHAAGGNLQPGDRVDVIEVRSDAASYIAADAEVLAVSGGTDQGALPSGESFAVTLGIDAETALRLAMALREQTVELVRATGAAPAEVSSYSPLADGSTGKAAPSATGPTAPASAGPAQAAAATPENGDR